MRAIFAVAMLVIAATSLIMGQAHSRCIPRGWRKCCSRSLLW
jgi:hypothetical protein